MSDRQVPAVKERWRRDIELISHQALRSACPRVLSKPTWTPLLDVLEDWIPKLGFRYHVDDQLGAGVEGMTDPKEGLLHISPVTYDGLLRGEGRSRFTVAHEIGHVVLHAKELGHPSVTRSGTQLYRRSNLPINRDPEWQANLFAAFFLMPSPTFSQVRRHHVDVARAFGTSYTAAGIRLKNHTR